MCSAKCAELCQDIVGSAVAPFSRPFLSFGCGGVHVLDDECVRPRKCAVVGSRSYDNFWHAEDVRLKEPFVAIPVVCQRYNSGQK